MKIIFFGSSDLSVPFLEKINDSRHQVVSVITGMDKKKGRGRKITANPVKAIALKLGLEVFEIEKIDSPFLERFYGMDFNFAVVVSFGMILPREVFEKFPGKWINVHPSLLPRYRGPAPMMAALLNGDNYTGVTINDVVYEVDTGKIYAQAMFRIEEQDNMADLKDKVVRFGGPILISALDLIEDKGYKPFPQSVEGVSYSSKISSRDLKIDWNWSSVKISNRIRAFSPKPGAYTSWQGSRLKILKARIDKGKKPEEALAGEIPGKSGIVMDAGREEGLVVACGDGRLLVIEIIQPQGKKAMSYKDFINGYRIKAGDFFE